MTLLWNGAQRPRNRHETIAMYGDPTRGGVFACESPETCDPAWIKANIVELHGDNAIAEIPPRFYFQCHRKVEDGIRRGFAKAHAACPSYSIIESASFVPRHMRHNMDMPLSVHAFGAALDINSDDNQAAYIPHRELPEPWSAEWIKRWPKGLPREFVEAWTADGWEWGGAWTMPDHRGLVFIDPMHLQAGR